MHVVPRYCLPCIDPTHLAHTLHTAVALDYNEYKNKYFPLLFQYQSIDPSNVDDAEEFIRKNPEILSEHATGYLLLRCMDLAMEDPSTSSSEPPQKKMRKVARLEMLLQYIMDLAGSLKQDPRSAVAPFFRRLEDEKVRTGSACSTHLPEFERVTVVSSSRGGARSRMLRADANNGDIIVPGHTRSIVICN